MKPPPNVKTFEGELATYWLDENGILCSLGKPSARTMEIQKETFRLMREIADNKKVCYLSDTTYLSSPNKEIRDYMAKELPGIIKAMAVISVSALGKMVANLFLATEPHNVPMKYFEDEASAKDWLKQYL